MITFPEANTISSGRYTWQGKRVLVTGGAGFVGSYLVEDLVALGAKVRVADNLTEGTLDNLADVSDQVEFCQVDLREREATLATAQDCDVVMHLAAKAYGMQFSMQHNYEVLRDNTLMAIQVLDACVEHGVERALMVSSSCVYDDDAPIPTRELPVHLGLPESVNEGYGWGKRMLEVQARYASMQHGLPVAIVRPFNAFGGRYRWHGEASHVVPSLVKKVLDQNGPVVIWGSGEQVRDLLHARDFALGFRLAAECATDCEPVNLAGGTTVRLTDLALRIAEAAGIGIELEYDLKKQEGRRHKEADLTKLNTDIPAFHQTVSLDMGIEDMIEWDRRQRSTGVY